MSKKVVITCEGCGVAGDGIVGRDEDSKIVIKMPQGWREAVNTKGTFDLCPQCWYKYDKSLDPRTWPRERPGVVKPLEGFPNDSNGLR